MTLTLSPAKIILLAVELASKAEVDGLWYLAAQHSTILRKDILLRILLTYLPEAVPSRRYVSFIEEIHNGEYPQREPVEVDLTTVEKWTEEEATKQVRKLHLLKLTSHETPSEAAEDPITLFLLRRAYKVDEEAGLLDTLPDLLVPFLDHSPCIRTLLVSAILPLLRRNFEYYPENPLNETLHDFQHLPDRTAASLLLEETGAHGDDLRSVGRDLRTLIGPWMFKYKRWDTETDDDAEGGPTPGSASSPSEAQSYPGWAQVLEWLTTQASQSWKVALCAVEQWDGPGDVDLGGYGAMWMKDDEQEALEKSWARAALASAYLIPEASADALSGAHSIVTQITGLLDQDPSPPLQSAAALLSPITAQEVIDISTAKNATYLRNNLLDEANPLTGLTKGATLLLHGLTLSAFLLTRSGAPCTVRRAGELVLLQDEREQKTEFTTLIHHLSNNGPKSDDKYWIKVRNEILWLRDWGSEEDSTSPEQHIKGVFGQIKKECLEVEILKALLANSRYTLARSLYEDLPDQPLPKEVLRDTIFAAAYNAFDSASNPNRTRGGLKKCDDIIKAFPKTIEKSLPATRRIESLLKATHALSEYRIVLKQGEPFTPVFLRVHQDPIAIVGKILEQNRKSYTRIHDLVDLGTNMVSAGLTRKPAKSSTTTTEITAEEEVPARLTAQQRITAMCIDAALAEDDFETAYSYVTNRLCPLSPSSPLLQNDEYSWRAALQTGKYRRSTTTSSSSHYRTPANRIGTGFASANPEIRHLEQRIECLAIALRIAPKSTLTEILNAYRRVEEELVSALKVEREREEEWDERGEGLAKRSHMPGAFASPGAPARHGSVATAGGPKQAAGEEKPMSLFDLSRAATASAQRNLTALSSLQRSGLGRLAGGLGGAAAGFVGGAGAAESAGSGGASDDEDGHGKRTRRRDQLREAAMGTLVSGVGWLVGAPTAGTGTPRE